MTPLDLLSPAATGPILELMIYAAWVDRDVALSEVDAILGASHFLAPSRPFPELLSSLTGEPPPPPRSVRSISVGERHLAFALAAWVIEADGIESPDELAFLGGLRRELGLDDDVAERLLAMARWLRSCRPAGLPSSTEMGVVLVETLNVLIRVDAPWPPRRDPFARHRGRPLQ